MKSRKSLGEDPLTDRYGDEAELGFIGTVSREAGRREKKVTQSRQSFSQGSRPDESRKKVYSFYLDEQLVERMRELAGKVNMNYSAVAGYAIEELLRKYR